MQHTEMPHGWKHVNCSYLMCFVVVLLAVVGRCLKQNNFTSKHEIDDRQHESFVNVKEPQSSQSQRLCDQIPFDSFQLH
jgi:hypothetical protein